MTEWNSLKVIRERWQNVTPGSIRESQISYHAARDIQSLLGDIDALRKQLSKLGNEKMLLRRAERAEKALDEIHKKLESFYRYFKKDRD